MEENMSTERETKPENLTPEGGSANKFERLEVVPDFDGGNFTMMLSSSPQGFEIKTDKSFTRSDSSFPYPLRDSDKERIKANFPGQMRFTDGHIALDALKTLRQTDPENIVALGEARTDYETKRKAYLSRSTVGVGIRNIRRVGNLVQFDTRPVNFPVYKALSDSSSTKQLLEFGATSAVSMALITSDNRLLVTHRSPKNDPYGDMPGASVAGYIDADFQRKTRTIKPLTTADVKNNIVREMEEELGLERNDIAQISLDGLVLEKTQVHHEFVFSGKLNLTSEEVKQKSMRERNMHAEEFEERFVDIEASPESIFDLLTRLDCPIPPTHAAVFAATGYRLMLEREGANKAQEYKLALEKGVKANSERIDSIVKEFYIKNPNVLNSPTQRQQAKIDIALRDYENKNPSASDKARADLRRALMDNLPPRNLDGYNPFYLPSEQGLSDFNSALKNAGLLN